MSGSELMEKLQSYTGGFWKPSPGSIYPLLSWLQENNYIAELPADNGLKRYELTANGKALLNEQKNVMQKFEEIMGKPQQPFGNLFMRLSPEKADQVRETMKRTGAAMFRLGTVLQENLSEQAVDEAIQAVNEAAERIEQVTKKIIQNKGEIDERK
jgi:DNA-binding PadR family transcriptional regulator